MESELDLKLESRKPVIESQDELLHLVTSRGRVPIRELADKMENVNYLVQRGVLVLEITVYSWGLDFALVPRLVSTNSQVFPDG